MVETIIFFLKLFVTKFHFIRYTSNWKRNRFYWLQWYKVKPFTSYTFYLRHNFINQTRFNEKNSFLSIPFLPLLSIQTRSKSSPWLSLIWAWEKSRSLWKCFTFGPLLSPLRVFFFSKASKFLSQVGYGALLLLLFS